jgi:hypothetical protein
MNKPYQTLPEAQQFSGINKAYGTLPEAVQFSGLSRTSIYEALKRGDVTARKAGRRTLILFADLEAYLSSLPAYQAGV